MCRVTDARHEASSCDEMGRREIGRSPDLVGVPIWLEAWRVPIW